MVSYLGWITHSDSYGLFEKWIKPHLHIQILKRIIRNGKELPHEISQIRIAQLSA